MRVVSRVAVAVMGLSVMTSMAAAQARRPTSPAPAARPAPAKAASSEGFTNGYTDIGGVIGLGGIGSASLAFGGRFEHGFKDLPNASDGVLGWGIGVDWYHYSNSFASWTYLPIGGYVNYHFNVKSNRKIDPFLGAGLGYEHISCSIKLTNFNGCSSSGIYFIGHVGARYFVSPTLALYADAGAGAGTLHVGATLRLKGK